MVIRYGDALSGESIYIKGVGHARSPFLKDLRPKTGIGLKRYNFYLNFLMWEKEEILKYDSLIKYKGVEKLDNEALTCFDIIVLVDSTRLLCLEVLSFFMDEKLKWDNTNKCFLVISNSDPEKIVGKITRKNFGLVRQVIKNLNYIELEDDNSKREFKNEETHRRWDMVQGFLKQQRKENSTKENPERSIENVISKICAFHSSYNLLNIYDLTIFQLYDTFYQLSHKKGNELRERIYSHHGGDKFRFEDWLKPIFKNK